MLYFGVERLLYVGCWECFLFYYYGLFVTGKLIENEGNIVFLGGIFSIFFLKMHIL